MSRWKGPSGQQRLLEEIKEWKLEEAEHISLILQSAPTLEPAYINLLREWQPLLERTAAAAEALLESRLSRADAGSSEAELETAWPSAVESETAESDATRGIAAAEPGLAGTAAAEPGSVQPTAAQWDLAQPAAAQPGWEQPTEARPISAEPATAQPSSSELLEASAAQSSALVQQLLQLLGSSSTLGRDVSARAVVHHTLRESTACLAKIEVAQLEALRESADTELEEEENRTGTPASGTAVGAGTVGEWKQVPIGGHTLPPLPYPYNALEPYIDEKTMRIHHDKHHQTYVNDLNKAEIQLQESRKSGNFDLVKHWERELAFNGAGHYLHTLFWTVMSPQGGGRPVGTLGDAIDRDFGSFDAFKKQFSEAANKVEGGGWAILVWSPRSRRLEILQAEKHQDLSQWDAIPLLPLDVWEHAYYLKHQNVRADYVKDWWNVVNWPYVNQRFEKAKMLAWEPF
ncbi:Fe-Mn family superoxide dismutase [Paenibacillus herberti]|uniref:superoxide dismutase n=1 Tax=Paenibacillus herberti TaxID=1619309 RepID=A0A229NVZ3_9BACL|nr:Fe-Mn family superoxide dismutase [Paenibacillus herberti]OXM14030.1 superoxide dismutase [Paenibacillus herberti]